MAMRIANEKLPVSVNLIISEETSPGNSQPLLQHFPAVFVPHIGDKISIEEESGTFTVTDVTYTFHAKGQNRQGVMVTVKRS